MREIEFRAWHPKGKKMVYFEPKDLPSDIYQAQALCQLMLDKSPLLMQKLSLKDFNGKSIYEGDILEKQAYDGQEYMRAGVVVWDCDGFCLKLIKHYDPEKIGGMYSLPYQGGRQINMPTVIGNIYENPEFLEE